MLVDRLLERDCVGWESSSRRIVELSKRMTEKGKSAGGVGRRVKLKDRCHEKRRVHEIGNTRTEMAQLGSMRRTRDVGALWPWL